MTARDGALGVRRRRMLDRHLGRCAACRAERASIEAVLAAVERLPWEAEVPARLEGEVLRRVRVLAADDDAGGGLRVAFSWLQRLAPAVAATAVVVLATVGVRTIEVGPPPHDAVRSAPGPRPAVVRRAKVRPPDHPPPVLASRPELFVDLPMLRDLEKLQHFESIAAMDDGDAGTPSGDGPPPSG